MGSYAPRDYRVILSVYAATFPVAGQLWPQGTVSPQGQLDSVARPPLRNCWRSIVTSLVDPGRVAEYFGLGTTPPPENGAARGASRIRSLASSRVRQRNGSFAAVSSEPETDTARIPEIVLRRVVELVGEACHQVIDLHRANLEGFIDGNVKAATDGQGESISCR